MVLKERGVSKNFPISLLTLNSAKKNAMLTQNWNWSTRSVRIACVRLFATTDRNVICYTAVCVCPTRSRTGIHAFVARTALITWAICVQKTLGSAGTVWITNIITRTDAIYGSILRLAQSVRSAWIGIARPWWLHHIWFDYGILNKPIGSF